MANIGILIMNSHNSHKDHDYENIIYKHIEKYLKQGSNVTVVFSYIGQNVQEEIFKCHYKHVNNNSEVNWDKKEYEYKKGKWRGNWSKKHVEFVTDETKKAVERKKIDMERDVEFQEFGTLKTMIVPVTKSIEKDKNAYEYIATQILLYRRGERKRKMKGMKKDKYWKQNREHFFCQIPYYTSENVIFQQIFWNMLNKGIKEIHIFYPDDFEDFQLQGRAMFPFFHPEMEGVKFGGISPDRPGFPRNKDWFPEEWVQKQERLQNRIKIKHINSTNEKINPSII